MVRTRRSARASRFARVVDYLAAMVRAMWNLFLLGCKAGFNTSNPYWKWRKETAFGSDPARMPSAAEQRRAMIEYGEWVGHMRALQKRR